MTAKEAYKKLVSKWPDLDAISCREYDSLFVFCVVPRGATNVKNAEKRFDCLCSVNKKTSVVKTFKPFAIPVREFRTGKDIKTFK